MEKKDLTKNVITYLIRKLDKKTEGRKKLVKMMFLVEHYDTQNKKITKETEIGNEFIIYHYGVFSFDVMNNYTELVVEGTIQDSIPITLKKDIEEDLPERIRNKVDEIVKQFGFKTGYELEIETLTMLNISKFEKPKFFGKPVRQLIKD